MTRFSITHTHRTARPHAYFTDAITSTFDVVDACFAITLTDMHCLKTYVLVNCSWPTQKVHIPPTLRLKPLHISYHETSVPDAYSHPENYSTECTIKQVLVQTKTWPSSSHGSRALLSKTIRPPAAKHSHLNFCGNVLFSVLKTWVHSLGVVCFTGHLSYFCLGKF